MIEIDSAQEFVLLRLDGDLERESASALEEALDNLDSEPVIIVSLENVVALDSTIVRVFERAQSERAGNLVLIVPPRERSHAALASDRFRVATSVDAAIGLSRMLRDVAAASFSRDGVVITEPTSEDVA